MMYAPTVLPNAADGNAKTSVKVAILDQNVCAVGLHADAVVSIVDDPVTERDIIHIDSVCAIGLCGQVSVQVLIWAAYVCSGG